MSKEGGRGYEAPVWRINRPQKTLRLVLGFAHFWWFLCKTLLKCATCRSILYQKGWFLQVLLHTMCLEVRKTGKSCPMKCQLFCLDPASQHCVCCPKKSCILPIINGYVKSPWNYLALFWENQLQNLLKEAKGKTRYLTFSCCFGSIKTWYQY